MEIPINKENWKFIVLIVGIITLLTVILAFIFGKPFFYTNKFSANNTTNSQNEGVEKLSVNDEKALQNQLAQIVKTDDLSRCQEINNQLYRTVCINNISVQLATDKKDLSYCQKMDGNLMTKDSCERRVIFDKSQEAGDINVCDETQRDNLKNDCRKVFWPSLTIKKGDISFCDNISSDEEKTNCKNDYIYQKEFLSKTASFGCSKFLGDDVKADCAIYKKNLNSNSLDFCKNLKSGLFLNACLNRQ